MRRIVLLLGALSVAGWLAASEPGLGQGTSLGGTATWSIELLREYVQKTYKVDMPAEPAAFPNQAMLSKLNPEFALRLKALKAFHQAVGGTPNVGLMAGTGGLRSAEDQRQIYAQCRRKRSIFVNGFRTPADGTHKEDWMEIPESERNDRNCPRYADGTRGPATRAWVSWHQLGVAADFALPAQADSASAFGKTMNLAKDLGMIYGGWWGLVPGRWTEADGELCVVGPHGSLRREGSTYTPEQLGWDPGHVEWHPKLRDPERLATRPGFSSGTALRDDQVDAGYRWSIPATVYRVIRRGSEPGSLEADELIVKDGWVCVQRSWSIQEKTNGWDGLWTRFEPALPLFPVNIPTTTFARDEESYPSDRQRRQTVTVTSEDYSETDGAKSHGRRKGAFEFRLRLAMTDYLKTASTLYAMKAPEAQRFAAFRDTSMYDVHAFYGTDEISLTIELRKVDSDGYTTDSTFQAKNAVPTPGVSLLWDREQGRVGYLQTSATEVYSFGASQQHGDGSVSVLSGTPPTGRLNQPQPPPWTTPNPRPSPSASPTPTGTPSNGWFRP